MDAIQSKSDITLRNSQCKNNANESRTPRKDGSSSQLKQKSPIVEIVDFELTNIKQEIDSKAEEQTMELELKVEIEPDSESTNRFSVSEPEPSRDENVKNIIQHDKEPNDPIDNERPLPPPLISKPIGSSFAPQAASHPLQPPPLMINPRLSNEDKTQHLVPQENDLMDDEIIKIKKEIREDIQSELMDTSGNMGSIGNSFMNSFQSSDKEIGQSNFDDRGVRNNAARISAMSASVASTVQSLQTNTTSLLPRSITNNQMYISKVNSLITTSSYVNLPLCTPNATVSLDPRPALNVIKEGVPSNALRIDTSEGSSYIRQVTAKQPQLQNILQTKPVNGTQFAHQSSNGLTPFYSLPAHAVQVVQQQMSNGGNQVKQGVIGQEVRERLVKHLEDKSGEIMIPGMANEIPRPEIPAIVTYNSEGQYSPSPSTPNKGPGRIK